MKLSISWCNNTEKRNSTVRNTSSMPDYSRHEPLKIGLLGFTSHQWWQTDGNDYYAILLDTDALQMLAIKLRVGLICFVILMTFWSIGRLHGIALQQRFSEIMHFWLAISPSWQNTVRSAIRKLETAAAVRCAVARVIFKGAACNL